MADYRVIATASATVMANGTTDPFSPEAQHARDSEVAKSLCRCGHMRILHYSGDVMKRDWRGATGPCQKHIRGGKTCHCKAFDSAAAARALNSEEPNG